MTIPRESLFFAGISLDSIALRKNSLERFLRGEASTTPRQRGLCALSPPLFSSFPHLFSIPHVPTNRLDFNTFDSSGHDLSHRITFTSEILTVALVVASPQRTRHALDNAGISITFSDPCHKCLCKPFDEQCKS